MRTSAQSLSLSAVALALTLAACADDGPRSRSTTPQATGCACGAGERCCDAATLGLAANLCIPAAESCPLPCASGGTCRIGTYCLDEGGAEATCVEDCDPWRRCGFNGCCGVGASCVDDACVIPDLAADSEGVEDSVSFYHRDVAVGSCEVAAGCVSAGVDRKLLGFSMLVGNISPAALSLGGVTASAFVTPACEGGTPVLPDLLGWRILALDNLVVASGTLPAACVADQAPIGGGGGTPTFTCAFQGLSGGWYDTQPRAGFCDAIDITDVPAGDYQLELTVNPGGALGDASLDNNTITVPLTIPSVSCAGSLCGGVCCDGPCNGGVCMLPDLQISTQALSSSYRLESVDFPSNSCAVVEGCIGGVGRRRLLRFDTTTPNLGNADLFLGDPDGNPAMEFSECHGHYHFDGYANYRLLDQDENVIAVGHKQAFCLLDSTRVDTSVSPFPTYSCEYQGISVGWADTYVSELDCQWIDVTGVPAGDYFLEVAINPEGFIAELDYQNNIGRVPVNIPVDPEACVPATEVCGDGLDQNCDGTADDGCSPVTGNDTCATAHALGNGGRFTASLESTTVADLTPSCGGVGGDLFFTFTLDAPEVVYLSTHGSDVDTVLAIWSGDCTGADVECSDDICGGTQSSWVGELPAATYYVGVKAKTSGVTGTVRLKLERGGTSDAKLLAGDGVYPSTTTGRDNDHDSSCAPDGGNGADDVFYFSTCPGDTNVSLHTCTGIAYAFDSTMEIRRGRLNGSVPGAGCNDDAQGECPARPRASKVTTTLRGNDAGDGLWFVVVDGYAGNDGGDFSLTADL